MSIVRILLMIMMAGFVTSCGDSLDVEGSESNAIIQECNQYYGIITESSDGEKFKVLVVHNGTIDFEIINAVANGIPVAVGVGVGMGGQFVSPADARFFPDLEHR